MRRAALLALLALVLAGCGGGGQKPDGEPAAGGCREVEQPEPKPAGEATPPSERLDPARRHALVVETSCGTFTIALDLESAPRTAASLVSLAADGFFDGTVFHRVVPGFVIQGGDPTGTGTGGPGYETVDPPAQDAVYSKGVVAMAKTQLDPPGAAGSQFFVVTAKDARLPPEYAIVGRVTEGLDTVERIGRLGDPATEQPTQPVVIEQVTVRTA